MKIHEIDQIIEKNENLYGYKLGWRLLNTKKEKIKANNGVLVVTLNPGTGKGNYINHDYKMSNEDGNSILHENWKSPLAGQLKMLLHQENEILNYGKTDEDFIENILQGYYIPYRSQSLESITMHDKIMMTCEEIWDCIIRENIESIKIINCVGKKIPFLKMKQILERNMFEELSSEIIPTGWGNITVDLIKYSYKGKRSNLIGFPHLSQFKIFGREKTHKEILDLARKICDLT